MQGGKVLSYYLQQICFLTVYSVLNNRYLGLLFLDPKTNIQHAYVSVLKAPEREIARQKVKEQNEALTH